ncbi:MAG: hypothetical protein ACTHU0_10450 [Kofleriaceae bacterium]
MATPQEAKRTRDNFSESVRERLAGEVGYRCSMPDCGVPTIGPSDTEPRGVSNSGVAAHITAAAPGGPRYDASLTPAERSSNENGIHCCAKHARIVDNDPTAYTAAQLRQWKADAVDLQRRAHSTGDIDPNGRVKLSRATRNDIASRALKAAMQCRAAIMTGFHVADQAKNIRNVLSRQIPAVVARIESWKIEIGDSTSAANNALMDIRIHWGIKSGEPTGLTALIDLITLLDEWTFWLSENVESILSRPHTKASNSGTHDWTGVFNGDVAVRRSLQDAIDAASSKVEVWAEPFIVSRSD